MKKIIEHAKAAQTDLEVQIIRSAGNRLAAILARTYHPEISLLDSARHDHRVFKTMAIEKLVKIALTEGAPRKMVMELAADEDRGGLAAQIIIAHYGSKIWFQVLKAFHSK